MEHLHLTIRQSDLDEYAETYFALHPKAKQKPLRQPIHPSINEWMIMRRPMMNALKQKWKDFIVWFIEKKGYANLHIQSCDMAFCAYYSTDRRHDVDNTVPKFILDGMVMAGLIEDDDREHVRRLTLSCDVDHEDPRTEIDIAIHKPEKKEKTKSEKATGKKSAPRRNSRAV